MKRRAHQVIQHHAASCNDMVRGCIVKPPLHQPISQFTKASSHFFLWTDMKICLEKKIKILYKKVLDFFFF